MDKKRQFLINTAYYGTIGLLIYLSAKYIFPILLPFAAAAVTACILSRISQKFFRWVPFSRKYTLLFLVTAGYGLIFAVIVLSAKKIFPIIGDLLVKLPEFYQEEIVPAVEKLSKRMEAIAFSQNPDAAARLQETVDQMLKKMEQASAEASVGWMKNVSGCLAKIPGVIIQWIIMIISTYFIAADYDFIIRFLRRNLPEKEWKLCCKIKKYGLYTIAAYAKSYSLLLLLTFLELFAGLWLLDIPYAGWISLGIAVFDILPIVGTGGILLPWAGICALLGNYSLAVGILALYLVITAVRNILEPKIVGRQIGLHPLVTLISMFVGAELAGIAGLILFPAALILWTHIKKEDSHEI